MDVENFDDHEMVLAVLNVKGEVVLRKEFKDLQGGLHTNLDLSWLSNGIYILTFQHGEVSHIAKLIKQ